MCKTVPGVASPGDNFIVPAASVVQTQHLLPELQTRKGCYL